MTALIARWRAASEPTRFVVGFCLIFAIAGLVVFADAYLL